MPKLVAPVERQGFTGADDAQSEHYGVVIPFLKNCEDGDGDADAAIWMIAMQILAWMA
jgi:hypothetical protein